jgi:cytochrome c5
MFMAFFRNGGRSILAHVSVAHDRKFLDRFNLTIGILAGVAVGILFLAFSIAGRTGRTAQLLSEREYQRQVAERIAPPVKVAIAGRDNTALSIIPDAGAKRADTAVTIPKTGTEVYQQVCVACHGQGIGGAPRAGDAAAWGARVAKGKDTLYMHAIEGFKGTAGVMPPKGGRTDLSDDLIKAAVDHLIELTG